MTLTLRSRLTLVYTVVFGLLLVAIAVLSYSVLAYQLDADVTTSLTELTSGLHGYLRFRDKVPTVEFDATDPAEAAFIEEATRYYQIPLARDAVDVGTLAASLVDQLEPVARANGIVLQCERTDTAIVEGDADWLKRLVLNVLDNAIKFTPQGGRVTVAVSREGGVARVAVRDTGIGIDAAAKPHIFERFFRADPARSSGVDGAGLGLSMANWVVTRHHGRIEVDSHPGEGSTFTVHLPLARQ